MYQKHRRLRKKQEQDKAYNDRSDIALPPLKTGKQVRFYRDDEWEPVRVVQVSNTPRSYILKTPYGDVYRRNRVHLHNDKSAPAQQPAVTAKPTSIELKVAKMQTIHLKPLQWDKNYHTHKAPVMATTLLRKADEKAKMVWWMTAIQVNIAFRFVVYF